MSLIILKTGQYGSFRYFYHIKNTIKKYNLEMSDVTGLQALPYSSFNAAHGTIY